MSVTVRKPTTGRVAPSRASRYRRSAVIRRLARTLVLLAVALGMFPGGELLVEHVTELARHGHPAHSVPGEPDPFAAQHGCSPAEQNCSCPHAQPTTAHGKAEAGAFPQDHWLTWMLESERAARRPASARRQVENEVAPANRSTAPPTPPANA